jgi:hypothetical protein
VRQQHKTTAEMRSEIEKLARHLRVRRVRSGGPWPGWVRDLYYATGAPEGTKIDWIHKSDAESLAQRGFAVLEGNPKRRGGSSGTHYLVTMTPAAFDVVDDALGTVS